MDSGGVGLDVWIAEGRGWQAAAQGELDAQPVLDVWREEGRGWQEELK